MAFSTFAATTDRSPSGTGPLRGRTPGIAVTFEGEAPTKEVTFEPVEGPVLNSIDDAYQAKYRDNHGISNR